MFSIGLINLSFSFFPLQLIQFLGLFYVILEVFECLKDNSNDLIK